MSSDFDRGRNLAVLLAGRGPVSQQVLQGLLSDVCGSDVRLASSFRMLLSNSLYISALCHDEPITDAQLLALLDIARDGLSVTLFDSVQDFLMGYASHANRSICREGPHEGGTEPVAMHSRDTKRGHFPLVSSLSTSDAEPATVYASAAEPKQSGAPATPSGAPNQPRSKAQLRIFIGAAVLLAGVLVSFKVPALCEPFGLCLNSTKTDEPKDGKPKPEPATAAPPRESTSQPTPAALVPEDGDARPESLPSPKSESPSRVSQERPAPAYPRQPTYQRPQFSESPAPNAPLREEPLW